jgi:hypothetical protein
MFHAYALFRLGYPHLYKPLLLVVGGWYLVVVVKIREVLLTRLRVTYFVIAMIFNSA